MGYSLILVISILSVPIVYPYKGIFLNPNTMALNLLTLGTIINVKISIHKNTIKVGYYITYLVVTLILILMSGARTNLIILIFIFISIINIKKSLINTKQYINILLLTLFILILSKILLDNAEIWKGILNKTTSADNLLSGRFEIWINTLKDIKVFGNGQEYFFNTYNLGSHNSYLKVLGGNGIVTFVLYIIFCIIALFKSITYLKFSTNI